ncbi:energy transducer TonB [Pontibacter diazotrophicus]|uniref:Energy transducer TonB n=1 Tax=Pontibacter diazotrophicus TaxID=1400979 RepID=A0A3D8L9U1_9BACT|nr:energy transducer TonB [Pontibacter diazotrophicus]RDV13732.1 energy transducer TonB [Pontibacter diazotrophicus]
MKKHNLFHLLYKIPLLALLLILVACATDEEPVAVHQPETETLPPKQEYTGIEYTTVYKSVDQMPAFEEGEEKMFEFLHEHVHYPQEAKKAGVEGMVVVQFIVEKDGSITDLELVKSLHPEIDKEALRVTSMMNKKWDPGIQNNKPVRVQHTLPMRFTIK